VTNLFRPRREVGGTAERCYNGGMATRTRTQVTALLVVAAVLVGIAGVSAVRAGSPTELPPVPPQELLASSLEALAAPFAISGDVTTRFETGLPDISGTLGSTGTGLGGLATALFGTQHYKVWRSDDGVRIARVSDLSEQVVVANRDEAWYWDSNGMTAARLDLAALTRRAAADPAWAGMTAPTRADLTSWIGSALTALSPYADVSVDPSGEVAGRPAYDLVLTPAPGPTLIGRVTVAIDAETRLPLRFSVTPKGSDDAAAEIGFDAVSFDPIDPGMFAFDPPQGARVSEVTPPETNPHPEWMPDERVQGLAPGDVRVFGTGFSSRVAVRLSGPLPEQAQALLPYAGPLFSAVVAQRGGDSWLLIGPVPVATLERDADRLP
jgi:outer membrane lipoprotein-sorting protein